MPNTNGTYTIEGKEGQTIWEIALQEYGSVEGVRMLMQDNPGWYSSLLFFPAMSIFGGVTLRYGNVLNAQTKKQFQKKSPGNSNVLVDIGNSKGPEDKYYNYI